MEHISYAIDSHTAVITLNRPDKLNAFTDLMEQELLDAFDKTDSDDNVRAVVLTGSGRAFCAGMDLGESDPVHTFTAWRTSPTAPARTQFDGGEELPIRRDGGGRVTLRIFDSTKPVISAINGHAVGVGATMTLATDLRLGSEQAKFAFPFVQRAFTPESCSSWFLPRVVPVQVAAEWMLTGRTFDAAEALHGGLLRSIHPASDVLPAALELAHEIARNGSPVSVAATRKLLWHMLTASHPMAAHEVETLALNSRGISADAREGVSAFFEKRQPEFTDRVSTDSPDVLHTLTSPPYTPPTR